MIHSLLDVMYAKAPYTVVERAMHIHPTVSELIPTMLGRAEAPLNGVYRRTFSDSGEGQLVKKIGRDA